jgi:Plasmid pRiA4b ORF-3-like protein
LNDHLYSFWLDGRFWGSPSTEYTAPVEADEGVATADVVIAKLGLMPGAKIAYVFDFGDSWRVALPLNERTDDARGHYPRVVAAEGEAPPQYPDLDEDEAAADRSVTVAHRQSSRVIEELYVPVAVSRSDSLELEQKRAELTRADILGRVLLRVPPHRRPRRKLDLLGFAGR